MAAFPRVGPSHRRVRWPGDLLFVTQTRAPAHQAGRVLGARTIANASVPVYRDTPGAMFGGAHSGTGGSPSRGVGLGELALVGGFRWEARR
jgi:hypothetical protein